MVRKSTVSDDAILLYIRKMTNFNYSCLVPPSPLELRQKHAECKIAALDYLITNSIGEGRSWKLEQEIERVFQSIKEINRSERKSTTFKTRTWLPSDGFFL